MNEERMERELGWDDEITEEGGEFILLPEGDYNFTVTAFERGRHNGSEKLPPCNKAILSLRIETPEGAATIRHNLFLHSRTEGMISQFLLSIGQKKHGEPIRPRWNEMVGATGRAKVYIDKWEGNDGKEHESNKIKRFYEKDDSTESAAPADVAAAFTPGNF